jgi:hypothetical protein
MSHMKSQPNLPLVQSYHPTTFLERGCSVPFTTPMLAGARARPAERGGTELVVPSPSGGRGNYVLPWNSVRELCRPTVHDHRLNQKVAALQAVTPSAIRRAAREVAAEGLAGQEALSAAETARAAEHEETLLANFLLLLALLDQVEPGEDHALADRGRAGTGLEARAKRAIARIAPRIGRSPEAIALALEELAPVFAPIGVGPHAGESRAGRALERLRATRVGVGEWGARNGEDESGSQAEMIARVADLTISCAEATLEEAHGLTADMVGLLQRWTTSPRDVRQFATRPEWLLDGWEQICLLWTDADSDGRRRAALAEMALLVPVIPREASDWVGLPIEMEGLLRFRRTVSLNEDWRTGSAVIDIIARNEHFRALAA